MNKTDIVDGIYVIYDFAGYNTYIQYNTYISEELEKQTKWGNFTINDKLLPRSGCFEGNNYYIDEIKISPWLRCPSIENQEIYPMSDITLYIKDQIKELTGFDTNIAKIQKYDNGTIGIHSHSDKIIDLDEHTPIFIARFGEARTCVLTNKETNEIIEVKLGNNSLLVLSYEANLKWKHGISYKDETTKPSYSIVFRKSITFLHPSGFVFGENTPFKTLDDLTEFLKEKENRINNYFTKERQKKVIIGCYKEENKNEIDISTYKKIIENCIYPY